MSRSLYRIEEAQQKNIRAKHRAVETSSALSPKHRILAPQFQQVPMELINFLVGLALVEIEFTSLEGFFVARVGNESLCLGVRPG